MVVSDCWILLAVCRAVGVYGMLLFIVWFCLMMFVASCLWLLHVVAVCRTVCVVGSVLLGVCCVSLSARCVLFAVRCLLSVFGCVLFDVCLWLCFALSRVLV